MPLIDFILQSDKVLEREDTGISLGPKMSSASVHLPVDHEQTNQQVHWTKSAPIPCDRVDTAPTPEKPVAHVKPLEVRGPIPIAEFPSFIQKRRQTDTSDTEFSVCGIFHMIWS